MQFALTPEQKMIQKVAREFAEKEIEPYAAEIDETGEYPMEILEKLGKLGFMGLAYPKEYGGSGAGYVAYALVAEEVAKACASTAMTLGGNASLASLPIYAFGTKAQKEKYLVPMVKGETIGAFALTEANAGSDAGNQQTTAVLEGDEYVLNGSKMFISSAGIAHTYVVTAVTGIVAEKGKKIISAFIVEDGTQGFTFGKKENKMGMHGSYTRELIFEDCRIPKENLLGKEGDGFKIAMTSLDSGRIGVGALSLGIAQAALEEAIKYSKSRIQFGKPIAKQQMVQVMIADMATEIDCARMLVHRAAWLKDNGMPFTKEGAMAKLYASETAMRCASRAVQIHGGYGYMREYKVERLFRDAKICEIFEGTSEVQRIVIAGQVLK
ncbi:acyl-CoA dehydrogenase [Geosporobacter ferrireducens]|uniref:Acyl-CoA dehydrogenase n=1 Tax=Geosporobacter ferrireducens TaxID=1424294 RepID=A0A1D8GFY5_9FIRM|nr:acyl-CoA dehydrogenase [Geosporobacter ferrireducens]AOT69818.1 acyl-CoA dehydrogenase [Geosporobacter ferrireducens]